MKSVAVIIAGGKGERFWPKSRSHLPKQFLPIIDGGKTMIQVTALRLLPLASYDDIFIVTNKEYVGLIKEQLPQIPQENILAEPRACGTAPCIAFAAAVINRKYEDAVMMVLPADHFIKLEEIYINTMRQAVETAEKYGSLVTIGITPTYPETGYGYINFDKDAGFDKNTGESPGVVYTVKRFVEKPDIDKAKEYLASGRYLWNSGMFVWKLSTILAKFESLLPDIYKGAMDIKNAFGTEEYTKVLEKTFAEFKPQSIDYGIMERSDHIYTIPGSFGWDDVGNWLALERINKANDNGNIVQGDAITIDTKDSIIFGGKKLIAIVGLEDIVVVDTDDALLICAKDATQDVKKVVDSLKSCNRNELI